MKLTLYVLFKKITWYWKEEIKISDLDIWDKRLKAF